MVGWACTQPFNLLGYDPTYLLYCMKLLHLNANAPFLQQGAVAVIGNFDGVHRGHQALLAALRDLAGKTHLPILVIVFEPQTREFFLKESSPPRLTNLRNKLLIFRQHQVDYVCCLRFNQKIAQMKAAEFAHHIIFSKLHVKYLLVGQDFRFGCDRAGDPLLLQEIGQNYNAQIINYPDVLLDNNRISSTLVRQTLQAGNLLEAERLLGRPFSLCGRVIHGDAQARQWGIPTANIQLTQSSLPMQGVFCVKVTLPNNTTYSGVANMGCRPTLDGKRNLLEIHLFNFAASLYGQRLEVCFIKKLRDERKFTSREQLIEQIHADVAAAKLYFNRSLGS